MMVLARPSSGYGGNKRRERAIERRTTLRPYFYSRHSLITTCSRFLFGTFGGISRRLGEGPAREGDWRERVSWIAGGSYRSGT